MRIDLPEKVEYIIKVLQEAGHEAYAVGGCVRDCMLGRVPQDWDVTTSADPYEVKELFRRTVDTGIKHGTVTVMFGEDGYEVTTYRLDGEYEDARHPKEVTFTKSLAEDLKRRDFTINAMAYNHKDGLVDLFDGVEDLKNKLIRCVGVPRERFDEDALRILRALRFSAQLGFSVDEATMKAIRERSMHLNKISAERIRDELNKLLLSALPERLITVGECGITDVVLPEVSRMLQQKSEAEIMLRGLTEYTTGTYEMHTALVLCWARLLSASLLHNGVCEGKERKAKAKQILQRLKFDNDTINKTASLTEYSTVSVRCDAYTVRKQMHYMGEEIFDLWRLFLSGKRDKDGNQEQREQLESLAQMVDEIRSGPYCVSLKQLAVSGADLIASGKKQGVGLGETLEYLLERVLEHPEWNEKEILLSMVEKNGDSAE